VPCSKRIKQLQQ
jgi:ubiquitin-like-conjugating enzyme ATG3